LFNEAFVSEINSRGNLDLETGKLIFHSKNCHIYKRQYKLVDDLLSPRSTVNTMPRMAQLMKSTAKEVQEE
jgi:thymidylate synthase